MGVGGRKKLQFLRHCSTGAPNNLSRAVQEVKFNNQVTEQPPNDQQAKSIHPMSMNSVGQMPDGKLLFKQNAR